MAFACQYDFRRPGSTKLKYKYRVKDNSIFRKIIRFKDKPDYPCNYFKIVPIYVYIIICLFSFVFLIIDIVTGFYISRNYEIVILILFALIFGISLIYVMVIITWWELVDYKEFKFTAEEKKLIMEAKKLRKIRKKEAKKMKKIRKNKK